MSKPPSRSHCHATLVLFHRVPVLSAASALFHCSALPSSFPGNFLFSCLLGRLDWHWPVVILLFSTVEQAPLSALYAAKLFHEVDTYSLLMEPCSFASLEDIKRRSLN
ncbi:hypothetical protein AAHE18_19G159600 [Arachis hypogaea]|uniref:Secreted protein n=1 Tax=Arachis hypogaea TaxID=3818 RepID=A0A6B9VA66_ARAHY|nr:uncharacterized protein DS421_19g659950 [Arachis hypogaea]